MAPVELVDITRSAFKAHSHAFYARLRAASPVCRVALSNRETAWLVARYDDVSSLLKDDRFAKDPANAMTPAQLRAQRRPPALFAPLMRNMLGLDDPHHARLKRLVQSAFTPRRVDQLASQTQVTADALIDNIGSRKRFDLIDDFAMPLPVTVVSMLLGVPKQDRDRFARWSHQLIRNTMTPLSVLISLPGMLAFMRYLRKLIEMKRAVPEDDLVSALVQANLDMKLDADELVAMSAILLSAGHETTTNLVGNGLLSLLDDHASLNALREQPQLLESGIEELLRFAGPVEMSTHRYAREDVDIAGTTIPRGSLVFGAIASANRDGSRFANADRLDLERVQNRYLTFGEGGHYCVGAALARLEGRIAFETLLRRLPHLEHADDPANLRWRSGLILRGLERFPLVNRIPGRTRML